MDDIIEQWDKTLLVKVWPTNDIDDVLTSLGIKIEDVTTTFWGFKWDRYEFIHSVDGND